MNCSLLWSYIELHDHASEDTAVDPLLYYSRIETQLTRTTNIPDVEGAMGVPCYTSDTLASLRICPELTGLSISSVLVTAAVVVDAVKSRIPAFPGDEVDTLLAYFLSRLELCNVSFNDAGEDAGNEEDSHPL